jgi:hypothetical protein
MPVQRTLFGRSISLPRRTPPRRIIFVFVIVVSFLITTLLFTTGSLFGSEDNIGDEILDPKPPPESWLSLPSIPISSIFNPFRPVAHKPPVQSNSTSGEIEWLSDWTWLNPFSSSITLDENRSVLPPLPSRPHIYTFYDSTAKEESATREAEDKLLLTWRKAWWAQGFRPMVLGRIESMENPLYETLQIQNLEPGLELDLARWLAWGQMGTGILSNYLAVPMGPYDDALLSYLRRGEFPFLRRYEGLGNGLFSGQKDAINAAIKVALENKSIGQAKSFLDIVPEDTFKVDKVHDSIAFYDSATITKLYKPIADKLYDSQAEGLALLPQLINSHLHLTFQTLFAKGVAVLNPMPEHMTALIDPAVRIASFLIECPQSPMPFTCPPNNQKCILCNPQKLIPITYPVLFRNESNMYSIGTVPHPYTCMSLNAQRDNIDTRFIRRKTERDPWLKAATKDKLGTIVGTAPRLVRFKEMVASPFGTAHSLWLTPEKDRDPMEGLDWFFGFHLPKNKTILEIPLSRRPPRPVRPPVKPDPERKAPTMDENELLLERDRLQKARTALKSKVKQQVAIKEASEAWNLADTEAWRFARAFTARRAVERLKWEHDESKVSKAGTEGKGAAKGRWLDWR